MNVLDVIFISGLLFSLISIFLSIPGNFIVVFNALWYGVVTSFQKFNFTFFLTLLIIAIIVELVEYVLIVIGARRYGASRWGVVGAIVGGIVGSFSGAFFSPIFGAVIGGVLGVIAGTLFVEKFLKKRSYYETYRALLGVLIGRVGALTIKAIGTVTMVVMVSYKLFL